MPSCTANPNRVWWTAPPLHQPPVRVVQKEEPLQLRSRQLPVEPAVRRCLLATEDSTGTRSTYEPATTGAPYRRILYLYTSDPNYRCKSQPRPLSAASRRRSFVDWCLGSVAGT